MPYRPPSPAYDRMTDAAPPTAARDTPKSQRTRARILDCAMKLFAEIGYAAATNPRIAEEAGLTRGAMLYHFPTREALVDAAVGHIQAARLALLSAAADQGAPGGDVADQAIDSYWAALQSTPFKAFAELEAAARLDADVRQRIAAAQSEFDHAQVGEPFARMISTGAGARFQASRDLARFMLEGLARAELTYDRDTRIEHLLAVIKRATHILNRKGPPQDLWPE